MPELRLRQCVFITVEYFPSVEENLTFSLVPPLQHQLELSCRRDIFLVTFSQIKTGT